MDLYRLESDSVGEKQVPIDVYYGIQSLRAKENFNISHKLLNKEMIFALAYLKKACAITNYEANVLDKKICDAIVYACDEILSGKYLAQFIVDSVQGGAGTSTNMNANEVIANIAIKKLNGNLGDYKIVNPNDHVNMSQSTNDIYPSAGKIALISLLNKFLPELDNLAEELNKKSKEFNDIIKMGRTQLQDAVPMRLGQSFCSFKCSILRDIEKIKEVMKDLHKLNMGATAIGSAINVPSYYLNNIDKNISLVLNDKYEMCSDLFDGTSNIDIYSRVSSVLKTCAINLSKMCNDLRLMSSGPKTGFAEINLPARQNGSSIMPGKINPVIPEVVNQVAFKVIGNDTTISMACEKGQLELNAFEPIIFYSLFEDIEFLINAVKTLTNNCIKGITANKDRCKFLLDSSVGIATALVPYIGYKESAKVAKESLLTGKSIKEIVIKNNLLDEQELNKILIPKNLTDAKF